MNNRVSKAFLFSLALFAMSAAWADTPAYKAALQLKQDGKAAEAEQAFLTIVQQEPENIAAIEQLAVVQSWQNKFAPAISNFKRALSINPAYSPARVGLARVSYWQGERAVALEEIERVIQDQPNVPDHWILKGDILMADAQPNRAREAYLQAQTLLGSRDNAELAKKIAQAKAPLKWRLSAGYIADKFSEHRSDGHSSYLQLGYTFDNKTTLYSRVEEYLGFDRTDTGLVLGAYVSPHKTLLLNGELYRNSNNANFRPNEQISINADFLFSDTWQPLFGYRLARYNLIDGGESDVETLIPGLRFNVANAALEFRHARSKNVDHTTTTTNTIKLNLNYASVSPYLVYSQGEEGLPPLDVAKISVIGGGAVFRISDTLGLRIDFSREDREDFYIHNALGAGLNVFF